MTTKEDIQRVLWNAAGSFRGKIDSGKYKDYILSMLFVKYLSDAMKEAKAELVEKYHGDEERVRRALQRGRFFVPEEASFDYLYENKKAPDIGSKINIALKAIENANIIIQSCMRCNILSSCNDILKSIDNSEE